MLLERLKSIQEEFEEFSDSFSRYSFLVALSSYVSPDQPELMRAENKYEGCQSQVWMSMECNEGMFCLKATSDTLIIRGILYVMMELYNGCTVKEIADTPIDLLKSCGLEEHFTSERSLGIQGINQKIYTFCSNV